MDKKSMLDAMVSHYTNGNKAKFATLLGVSAQTISAWMARNSFDTELIYTKCSYISADWLLSGEGSMLRNDQAQPTPPPVAQADSPGEAAIYYKMYKEEKAEKESKVENLTSKMLQMAEELGSLKAKLSQYEPGIEVLSKKTKGLGHAKSVSTEKPSSPNADNATSVTVP